MTHSAGSRDEWLPGGRRLPGVWGVVAGIVALAWHLLSLEWLRAPRWKNLPDATTQLQRVRQEQAAHPHSFWAQHIGSLKRLEFTSEAGVWYQVTVEPIWDDAPNGRIRVLIALDDGGRVAYHPLTESLLLELRR